jgi:hypothetical protein
VLRPDEDGIRPLVALTDVVLERGRLEDLAQSVWVATPGSANTEADALARHSLTTRPNALSLNRP